MVIFAREKRRTRFGRLLFVFISFSLLLAACGEQTPTSPPQTTITPDPTTTAEVSPTVVAVPSSPTVLPAVTATTTPMSDIDPNVAYTPGPTVASAITGAPGPRLPTTITPTPNYGTLPTPPRTLVARSVTPAATRSAGPPLAKGNFVVGTATGLYILSANGQDDRPLVSGAAFSNPKIAPDGSRVAAFRTDPLTLKQQLYIIDAQGGIKPINSDNDAIVSYSWSPDSKTLALTRANDNNADGRADENDKPNIWLYDVASAKQQSVGEGRDPAWSPDGVRLAYVIPGAVSAATDFDTTTRKLRKNPNSVGVYNVQANAKRTLVVSKGLELALSGASDDPTTKNLRASVRYFKEVNWHPDSKHITVSADATGPNGWRSGLIMTLTLEETTPRLLTAGGDAAARVAWSSDGKKLVYETEPQYPLKLQNGLSLGLLDSPDLNSPRPTKIFVGDPATRNYTRSPLWVNGGQQLAFLKSDNAILSLVDADGKNERALISGCNGFDWY